MRFLILGRSVGLKKKKKTKKNHKKSRNRRPLFPMTTLKVNIHIFGSTKCTIYRKKCSCFCSCFSLRCYYAHFSDLKSYFKWKCQKFGSVGRAKPRKTRGWPKKPNRRKQIEPGNGVETIFDTRFRLSRPFFVKWRWFVLMEWNLPVLNFAFHLPEPQRTGRFAHSYANILGG